ncbi:hypothetical protein B0H15DRAFT_951865 [Mycena belliarum]|uniref:Sugar phosphate transporter domain-containing protein n=1 Tax=Mycena belliarum TaxID=1033014 RepID=A0AAD6U3J8_9AGAR|nr:hypothetical protein B0H15DRAFT_951865 [Mycena belliae]
MQARSEPQSSQFQVAAVVTFYIVAALVMVFVNKAVLNNTPDLPFTFLFIQASIALLLLRLLAYLSHTSMKTALPVEFKVPRFNRATVMTILPYLTVGSSGLIFNTLCLANVDTAFFQIARGLLLPFTILVSSGYNGVRPQPQVLVAAFIVTCGFLIGSGPSFYKKTATNLSRDSAVALLYGCVSSFVLSIHAVLKKSALSDVGHSVLALSYFGNLFSILLLMPCMVIHGELGIMRKRIYDVNEDWTTFIVGSLVTGIFGFLLGMAGSLSIKVTSPVTHMFSSAARGVIQTMLGIAIFGDVLTSARAYSVTIITCGTIFYSYVQASKPRLRFPKSEDDVEKQPMLEKNGMA